MTNPENSSANYEPSQEDLKALYEGLFEAIKSPNPRHSVRSRPNNEQNPSATIHEVMLGQMDAQEVLRDEAAKYILVKAKEEISESTLGSGHTTILVEIAIGEPEDPVQIGRVYSLGKQPAMFPEEDPDDVDKYSIHKTLPSIEDTSFEMVIEDISHLTYAEQQALYPVIEEEESDELLYEMQEDMTRIVADDIAALERLTTVLLTN